MDTAYQIAAIALLLLVLGVGWVMTLLALPGNWLIAGTAAAYAWLGPQTGATQIHWSTIWTLIILALIGEIAEFLAGVVGAKRAGGSSRAAVYSLIGSLAGAIGGATVGIPIPVIGSAIGAVVGGALGAFGGAAIAEHSLGEQMQQSMKVGQAAFWGRLLGTVAKSAIASVMAVTAIVAICA
jgi:uncharacterized protein